ncbi:elongation factor P 5-aminopentanone reductase [Anaerotalea alkaliphila]|uniref:SDR family oxidoreductase n=1 Tax=Anaerotalea alkaliphila TaxID=2662126 RepID=A0A7X5HWC0_9FIRM|nr:SDR family oxidoreductase [Anaerotalea alkaliphila]NDL67661.1 SDR family oxidoreductase [Anaerotalea alkaliphila]
MESKKNVFVTGASRGIGKAIALGFAREGWNVAVNASRSLEELERTRREVEALGASCLYLPGDVSDFDQVGEMHSRILASFGQLDALVHNAGVAHYGLLTDLPPGEWHRILSTNLTSAYNLSHHIIPGMVRRQSGSIVFISSIWGVHGASCEAAYAASKGGLNALAKSLSKELGPSGIRVNAILCGGIDTAMNAHLSPEEVRMFNEGVSLGRMGTVEEIAEMACFLSSGKASYITGALLPVDGGY